MEPETFLNLLDSYWFFNKIQSNTEVPQPNSPKLSKQLSLHTRSNSDQLFINTNMNHCVVVVPHLETIRSDKEFSFQAEKVPECNKKQQKTRKRRLNKSLSELEVEELRGFMDMGFVFTEEAKEDSGLVEIVPGLQRLGSHEIVTGPKERPYLSEAWEEVSEIVSPLRSWRVPQVSNEIDMKDSLKWWAHTVASAVR